MSVAILSSSCLLRNVCKDNRAAMSGAIVSSSFLLCNVYLSACLVERFASQRVSLGPSESKTRLENRHENRHENRSKIGPGSSPGAPKIDLKSVPGPTRDAQWRSGTSRSRLGASRERPRRAPGAPGESPRTARDAQRGARERSGEGRGDQNRRRVASASEKIEFFSLGSFAKRRRTDFSTIFVSFWFFCKVCEPSKVLRLLAKTEVRPFAL